MYIDFKSRLKNKAFIVACVSGILLIVKSIGLQIFGIDLDLSKYNTIIDSVLGILVAMGIVNNSNTTNTGVSDDLPTTGENSDITNLVNKVEGIIADVANIATTVKEVKSIIDTPNTVIPDNKATEAVDVVAKSVTVEDTVNSTTTPVN